MPTVYRALRYAQVAQGAVLITQPRDLMYHGNLFTSGFRICILFTSGFRLRILAVPGYVRLRQVTQPEAIYLNSSMSSQRK